MNIARQCAGDERRVGRAVRACTWVGLTMIATATACVGRLGGDDPKSEGAGVVVVAEPIHRLNRLEYNRTVRDLLGTELTPADSFPPDSATEGFDNIADSLRLSPTLFELYTKAARQVVNAALDELPVYSVKLKAADIAGGGYAVGTTDWALFGSKLTANVELPEQVKGLLTVVAQGTKIGGAPAPALQVLIDGQSAASWTLSAAFPETLTVAVDLPPGPHKIELQVSNFVNEPVANNSNDVFARSVTLESTARRPPPGRPLLYICEAAEPGCYAKIIHNFARRAFRRPLGENERTSLQQLWSTLRTEEGDEPALRLTLRAVLTSPRFLYRAVRAEDVVKAGSLGDFALASRLSYFLWSTMPDEELFQDAATGRLSTEAGLQDAVRRMLASDKITGLRDGFAEQWLATRLLDIASPDLAVYPQFDEELRASMKAESKLFFQDFFTNELPVSRLMNPDFGFLNDRLAQHYGMGNMGSLGSAEPVRVSLSGDQRRGLLTLGSWITAQSSPGASSPVRRASWVLDRVLCSPVPPPPPGVVTELPGTTDLPIRERMAQHRTDPACSQCHNRMDPLGLGFEGFDGIAAPRELEGTLPIDTSGKLFDGPEFNGPRQLSELLEDDPRILSCVTQQLYTYAVGRGLRSSDTVIMKAIVRDSVEKNTTLPALIEAIVLSPGFRAPPTSFGDE